MKRPVQTLDSEQLARHCRFVADTWRRYGDAPDPADPVSPPEDAELAADPMATLRRYRQLASIHILWRDLSGDNDIAETGKALSALAADCLERALEAAERNVAERFGQLVDDDGKPCRLAILGLGKLGGNELNFNSDIDIVFVHGGEGQSDGRRRIEAAEWHKRVARELIDLLDSITGQGRVWIVDTRLRPFGDSGALVWSISAMEQYFLSEGRTWERYAWLKARSIAGDHRTGNDLIEALEPFIFKRYLDYGIFDSLRELHQRIDANSRSRQRRDDIKRGAGGIRELEFLVQSLQILRGGREAELRQQGLLPSLDACARLGLMPEDQADTLRDAYCYLRILENRLQAMTGRQGHELPDEPEQRESLAWLMGLPDWPSLTEELDHYRREVRQSFSERFREPDTEGQERGSLWPPDEGIVEQLKASGFEHPGDASEALNHLRRTLDKRPLSAEGRRRLDQLMPQLLTTVCEHDQPDIGLPDLLRLIEQISRRSAYLSLLRERPETLARLVRVFRASQRVAEWIIESPQLLDDLLDPVHGLELPTAPTPDPADREASMWALGRWRQAGFLRTALAELDDRLDPRAAGSQLAFVAAILLERVLAMSGELEGLAVIAYGNLGAKQLHYTSDLDLVFLHRDGDPPLRTVQRLINAMQMPLPGGKLFEIDTRLRPNGRAGLLVSRIESFDEYQRNKAWTWEHQALIRARWVAGDKSMQSEFESIRRQVMSQARDSQSTASDLADMRERQRHDRTESPSRKHMTDLQFICELGVLARSNDHPELLEHRHTLDQLEALAEIGWLDAGVAADLRDAWRQLMNIRHHGWLLRQIDEPDLETIEKRIRQAWEGAFDNQHPSQ